MNAPVRWFRSSAPNDVRLQRKDVRVAVAANVGGLRRRRSSNEKVGGATETRRSQRTVAIVAVVDASGKESVRDAVRMAKGRRERERSTVRRVLYEGEICRPALSLFRGDLHGFLIVGLEGKGRVHLLPS